VIAPVLDPWVEEGEFSCVWIEGTQLAALVPVAAHTS